MQIHLCIIAKEFPIIKDFTKMSLYFDFLYLQTRYNINLEIGSKIIEGSVLKHEKKKTRKA